MTGVLLLGTFFALLLGLPLLAQLSSHQSLKMVDAFYRAGSLVFGGGHVMLPLLQAAVVPNHWVSNETFLAGYGIAQAIPGPLSSFAAFLGASMKTNPTSWLGAMLCLISIFAPSFLLVMGILPFWEYLRRNVRIQSSLTGINAAVVGILLAALYNPVWTSAVHSSKDFSLVILAFAALVFWKFPPWLVVFLSAIAGWLASMVF